MDGLFFEKLVCAGMSNLKFNVRYVNDLNVFPIPDGDTGDNMLKTFMGGVNAMKAKDSDSLSDKATALSSGMLMSARGNSGVILSQFFAGIAEGLQGLLSANVSEFHRALVSGVQKAYKSVLHPVEGTMLTVARESVENTKTDCDNFNEFFSSYVDKMRKSLENTPSLLPVLKEADVIDSGGAGLLCIAEGMRDAVFGREIKDTDYVESVTDTDLSAFSEDDEMTYGYCTECLIRLQNAKVNISQFDHKVISDFLETVGDSVVAVREGSIVKIHVHTLTPEKVIEFCRKFGEMLTVKIENMTLQHNGEVRSVKKKKQTARKKFAIVTVATGEGLCNVFHELGADVVLSGGQSKNPSIESFIKAFDEANSDVIFVLPNNGNIIMSAKQAKQMYNGSDIRVIETKNLGQAYSILSMLDYSSDDADVIRDNMISDMQDVSTGMITRSVRDADIDGIVIKKDEYIGFTDKTMLVSSKDKLEAFDCLCEKLDAKQKDFIIAVYGTGITALDKKKTAELVSQKYSNVEFYEIDGGQNVYDYIVIIE